MSYNYYNFRKAKATIAETLMTKGWKVYGYHEDESDMMVDYWSPAWWDGIATKNGYVLVVDKQYNDESGKEIRERDTMVTAIDEKTREKIAKLEALANDDGATEGERKNAIAFIETMKAKKELNTEACWVVTGKYPEFMPNPSTSKWHIEKDGVIIAKGTGIGKFSTLPYRYNHIKDTVEERYQMNNITERTEKEDKIIKAYRTFINKIDTTAGNLIGEGELEQLEKVTEIKYKKENKTEVISDEIKAGADFILNNNFNNGCYKGLVYHIETVNNGYVEAFKYNKKLTKLCKGKATSSNRFWCMQSNLQKFIDRGAISLVKITEVQTPYEVEKWVKKKAKQPQNTVNVELEYDIKKDVDTRDNSTIYVVKVMTELSREQYVETSKAMSSIGGYYSKFKHGFIFKENPTDLLCKSMAS